MGEVEPTPDAACFAWSAAEILDRDECEPCPEWDQDWAGHCTNESGAPPVENGSTLLERLREMARVVGVVALDCCGEKP